MAEKDANINLGFVPQADSKSLSSITRASLSSVQQRKRPAQRDDALPIFGAKGQGVFQSKAYDVIHSQPVFVLMMLMVVYVLFGQLISEAALPKSSDFGFLQIGALVPVVLFGVEFGLNCLVRKAYSFKSMLWWLDLIAFASLIPDIVWIFGANSVSVWQQAPSLESIRMAARCAYISRLSWMIATWGWHVRKHVITGYSSVRLNQPRPSTYGVVMPASYHDAQVASSSHARRQGGKEVNTARREYIFRLVNKLTLGTIVLFVLLSLILSQQQDMSPQQGSLDMLVSVSALQFNATADWVREGILHEDNILQQLLVSFKLQHPNLVYLSVVGEYQQDDGLVVDRTAVAVHLSSVIETIRDYALAQLSATAHSSGGSLTLTAVGWFNMSDIFAQVAIQRLIATVTLLVILGVVGIALSHDAFMLFIRPVERMVRNLKRLAENPLSRIPVRRGRSLEEDYLETMLRKLAGLLSMGFGEAGARIISQNLCANGELEALCPGSKVAAIYGFCDVRNFTQMTECLEEDIIVLINMVGEIVHTECRRYNGAPNKNIGDAFLTVWKLPDFWDLQMKLSGTGALSASKNNMLQIEEEDITDSITCRGTTSVSFQPAAAQPDGGDGSTATGATNEDLDPPSSGSGTAGDSAAPGTALAGVGPKQSDAMSRSASLKVKVQETAGHVIGRTKSALRRQTHEDAPKAEPNHGNVVQIKETRGLSLTVRPILKNSQKRKLNAQRSRPELGALGTGLLGFGMSVTGKEEEHDGSNQGGPEEEEDEGEEVAVTETKGGLAGAFKLGFSPSRARKDGKTLETKRSVVVDVDTINIVPQAPEASHTGDGALIAYRNTAAEVYNSTDIQCLLLQNATFQQRMPGYRPRFGFGLHVGWSIEGAIGSKLKVEGTYLGPHVNIASRLESATKQYGVMLLMSGDFYKLLSAGIARDCRRVDRVLLKGTHDPMDIYCYDNIECAQKMGLAADESFNRAQFTSGVDAYLEGDWPKAYELLSECGQTGDGPSKAVLSFMERHGQTSESGSEGSANSNNVQSGHGCMLRAPEDWKGWHPLLEK